MRDIFNRNHSVPVNLECAPLFDAVCVSYRDFDDCQSSFLFIKHHDLRPAMFKLYSGVQFRTLCMSGLPNERHWFTVVDKS